MNAPVELIPLKCIRCDTPIPAGLDEVAWACRQCGQGQQIGEDGLASLEIHFAQGIQPPRKGHPYWVCEGRVNLERQTYSGLGKKTKDAEQFWGQPRKFFVPAFSYPLEDFTRVGVQWLQQSPALSSGPVVEFEPVTVASEDIQAWVEFLVLALEAERKDKVKSVRFTIQLGEPQLWILP